MNIEARAQALIDLVEADASAQCAALATEAQARARALVGEARSAARARATAALAEERRRLHTQLGAAEARLANARRQHAQQRHQILLDAAWQRLPALLTAHWRSPEHRARWIARVLEAGQASLPPGRWTLLHGADFSAADRELATALARRTQAELEFQAEPALAVGLQLRAGGNLIDGSAAGLLADRAAVGSRLLDALRENS
ncbi:MAG TPA: hypothetical protein P5024_13460 [Burkholderiaceae bacterium]|nr:hypothetical protein [Burkholderiaceae bacterium]